MDRHLKKQLMEFLHRQDTPKELGELIHEVKAAYQDVEDQCRFLERSVEQYEQELKQANVQYSSLFKCLPDTMFRTDAEGKILEILTERNDFDSPEGDVEEGDLVYQHLSKKIAAKFERAFKRVKKNLKPVTIEFSYAEKSDEGSVEARFVPLFKNQLIVLVRDISQRSSDLEAQLQHHSNHDQLTNLPNRNQFATELHKEVERYRENSKSSYAVIFMDLDRFKMVNDSLGHRSGDELLYIISETLGKVLGKNDLLSRFGGDEFAILLRDMQNSTYAERVIKKIQEIFSKPITIDGHELVVSFSIGVVLGNKVYKDSDEVLRNVDTAMYEAKNDGRAKHIYFDQNMYQEVKERLELEEDLRTALKKDQFELYYQPIIAMDSGEVVKFEALIRWNHPTRGLVSPADFIPVAEQSDLITEIGEWVLSTACVQNHGWHENGYEHLQVSVNFSARQFKNREVRGIAKKLKETGLNPAGLQIELTESIVMGNALDTVNGFNELKEIGISLAIDDFGTGYSSLVYLKQFPIDVIKIDQSFVRQLAAGSSDAAIVKAIIEMAHALNMSVVAEGVETQEQLEFLQSMNCDFVQGYLFSKPLPASKASDLLFEEKVFVPKHKRRSA